jgi:hypothetical protein
MRSAMDSLGCNRPALKHSELEWWEKLLLMAAPSSDRPGGRTGATGPFAMPRSRPGRSRTIDSMTGVIENQITRGMFISRHFRGKGIDVRMRNMSQREKRASAKDGDIRYRPIRRSGKDKGYR